MNLPRPHPGLIGALTRRPAPLFYRWNVALDEISWVGDHEAILGYAEREMPLTRRSWRSLVHPEDSRAVDRALASFLAGRGAVCLEHRVRAKDDAWRHIADEAAFQGKDTVFGTIRLGHQEDPFQRYVEAAPVGVWVWQIFRERLR